MIPMIAVETIEDLASCTADVPAMAYVRSVGNYYFKYVIHPSLFKTTGFHVVGDGWIPADIGCPYFDRPIHVTNTRWVETSDFAMDLDFVYDLFGGWNYDAIMNPGGFDREWWEDTIDEMNQHSGEVTTLEVGPGDLVLQDSEGSLRWWVASVEVLDHSDEAHTNLDVRRPMCWNLMPLSNAGIEARFRRVLHFIDSDEAFEGLHDQGKIITGDILARSNQWFYQLPLDAVEFTRSLTVWNRADFNKIKQGADLKRLYIINLSHEDQSWSRKIPQGIMPNFKVAETSWSRKHYPADFIWWEGSTE